MGFSDTAILKLRWSALDAWGEMYWGMTKQWLVGT